MNKAIRIIRDEHRSISAVLSGLIELTRVARNPGVQPGFAVFRAMIHYIDEFPERLHHPKEDRFLFARLAERAPETRPLVEELRKEHVRGAQLVRELESALLAYEVDGARALPAFDAAVSAYAQFHWDHMRKEEEQVLPLAAKAPDRSRLALDRGSLRRQPRPDRRPARAGLRAALPAHRQPRARAGRAWARPGGRRTKAARLRRAYARGRRAFRKTG